MLPTPRVSESLKGVQSVHKADHSKFSDIAQLVRANALYALGYEFESRYHYNE